MAATSVATALQSHPLVAGVRVAAPALTDTQQKPTVYVVLKPQAWQVPADLGRQHNMNWQRVYDAAYEHAAPDPLLDTTCWKDSYSGAPIPAEQMAEWVNDTVVRILELAPRRILEIGCGTGLLLYRLAPHCDEYVGLDISQTAVERLTADLAARSGDFAHVAVHQRGADQLQDFAARRFDLVIINSVVMYFPSEDYLSSVLDNAIGMVGQGGQEGGHVFVGDVRDRASADLFYLTVELARLGADAAAGELAAAVRKRAAIEKELLVPAAYFTALAERDKRISGVRVELKAGAARNEMTRFRYDATLAVGDAASGGRWPAIDGSTLDQDGAERIVKDAATLPCRMARLRNARLAREASLLAALVEDEAAPVRALLSRPDAPAIDPAALAATAKLHGRAISIQPSASGRVEEFDAIVWAAQEKPPEEVWSTRLPGRASGPRHALNLQLRLRMERQLTQALLKSLEPILGSVLGSTLGSTSDKAEPRPNIVLVDELPAD